MASQGCQTTCSRFVCVRVACHSDVVKGRHVRDSCGGVATRPTAAERHPRTCRFDLVLRRMYPRASPARPQILQCSLDQGLISEREATQLNTVLNLFHNNLMVREAALPRPLVPPESLGRALNGIFGGGRNQAAPVRTHAHCSVRFFGTARDIP